MKKAIVITYKTGSIINIDIPETFYSDMYKNTSEKKLHRIFMKDYGKFIAALNNKSHNIINVGKYLKFSTATVSCEDILGVDIKIVDDTTAFTEMGSNTFIPNVADKTYLDINESILDNVLEKLDTTNLIDNLNNFIEKINTMIAEGSIDIKIKAGAKKKVSANASKTPLNIDTLSIESNKAVEALEINNI